MKEKEFRKIVREEIQTLLSETTKGEILSKIYQWIIKGDMEKAMTALKYDPELMKLAKNIEELQKELLSRMSKDKKFTDFLLKTIEDSMENGD